MKRLRLFILVGIVFIVCGYGGQSSTLHGLAISNGDTDGAGKAVSALAVTTNGLHLAYISASYTATLSASGGTAPYTWSVSSGKLPPGLALKGTRGQINGTPRQAGTYTLTATVKDSAGKSASRSFTSPSRPREAARARPAAIAFSLKSMPLPWHPT